jgi:hypothetical protein
VIFDLAFLLPRWSGNKIIGPLPGYCLDAARSRPRPHEKTWLFDEAGMILKERLRSDYQANP